MSTGAAFLAAIAANPQDHLPKLVYADWLEEQNDPRAVFMRVQYALTQTSSLSAEWWQLHTRRAEVALTLDAFWVTGASAGLEWLDEIRHGSDLLNRLPLLAEAGNPAAMTDLAIDYWNPGGEKHDYANARKWLERAVDAGYARAMYLLGLMNRHGWGMWWTYPDAAAKLFRRASNLGFAPATVELAMMYAAGEGVRQNTARAVQLYRLAADAGEGKAHRILGNRYREGRGVPRDAAEALNHYRRAIELGDEEAREPFRQLWWEQPENWPKNQ